MHDEVLARCAFFKKCLTSGRREQQENTIKLPEDEPEAISIVVEWLYTKSFTSGIDGTAHIFAYVAADKYSLPELQNAILDDLNEYYRKTVHKLDKAVRPTWVTTAWKNANHSSKLCELVLDALVLGLVIQGKTLSTKPP